MEKIKKLKDLLNYLQTKDDFIITTHRSPDPDGIGSELALAFLFSKLGKKYSILNHDSIPERYLFIDPQRRIERMDNSKLVNPQNQYNIIIVDNSDIPRIGDVQTFLKEDKSNLILIDHHDNVAPFPGLFCFPEISSTSEIIYEILELAGIEPDYNTAVALYLGIIMDTGQFKYNKTKPRTHEIAAKLLKHNFQTEELSRRLFENFSHKVLFLKNDIYSTLEVLLPEYPIATVRITKEMLNKYHFNNNPVEGIASEILGSSDIFIAASFSEGDEGNTKISLRSKGDLDTCIVAKSFGGGGHKNASGASAKGDISTVRKQTLEKIKELFRKS